MRWVQKIPSHIKEIFDITPNTSGCSRGIGLSGKSYRYSGQLVLDRKKLHLHMLKLLIWLEVGSNSCKEREQKEQKSRLFKLSNAIHTQFWQSRWIPWNNGGSNALIGLKCAIAVSCRGRRQPHNQLEIDILKSAFNSPIADRWLWHFEQITLMNLIGNTFKS